MGQNREQEARAQVTLGYKVKLHPTRVKADMLGMLCALFAREQRASVDFCDGVVAREGKLVLKGKSQAGQGEFKQRARYRAVNDYKKAKKAARATKRAFTLPYLKAELCDAAEVQTPRKATGFDLWVHMEGLSRDCQLYLPAKKHRALNRALDYPGAKLSQSACVFRKNGKWYASVYVKIPCPEVTEPQGWIGCDVGVRSAVARSDGYRGPDLRPILKKQRERRAQQQRQGLDRSPSMTSQRQCLAREARKTVLVAQRSGRGIALEDPKRLIRWKQHAARFFAERAILLAALVGVAVSSISPPYTSITCSSCGAVKTFRRREMFRCLHCGYTQNADFNASRNIAQRAQHYGVPRNDSLTLLPGGGAGG